MFDSWLFDKNNNIITSSNNITLKKVKVEPYGFGKMYIKKYVFKDKLYRVIYQFRERKITLIQFHSILLK